MTIRYAPRPIFDRGPKRSSGGFSKRSTGSTSPRTDSNSMGERSSAPRSDSAYASRPSRSFGGGSRFGGASRGGFGGGSRGGYAGRPRFGGGGGGRRGGSRGGAGFMDISKFVNKAVITEEVEVYVPQHKFADFALDERLKTAIASRGYITPTPIQDKSIPHILEGKDVVGIANTGTGKTAAFLVPLIHKMLLNPKEKVLVMVPTRELALQIEQEFRSLVGTLRLWSVCAVGGAPIFPQVSNLRRVHNIVIGTPGRLKDLVERKALHLADFKTVVLDEADRMLDMGFINDMRFMLSHMNSDRHTLFFSATMSPEVGALINQFLKTPVMISVKTRDTSKNIDQDVVRVHPAKKVDALHDLLSQPDFQKVIIFGRTKHGVERLSETLLARGFKAVSIHGDKNHSKRQQALRLFKQNEVQVMVATDVAARGLDIADISHVINYDLPQSYEDYVHRIGRTGRGNKTGKALTFIDQH